MHFKVCKLASVVPPGDDLQSYVKCANTFAEFAAECYELYMA